MLPSQHSSEGVISAQSNTEVSTFCFFWRVGNGDGVIHTQSITYCKCFSLKELTRGIVKAQQCFVGLFIWFLGPYPLISFLLLGDCSSRLSALWTTAFCTFNSICYCCSPGSLQSFTSPLCLTLSLFASGETLLSHLLGASFPTVVLWSQVERWNKRKEPSAAVGLGTEEWFGQMLFLLPVQSFSVLQIR